jgi:hypothetical protein
MRARQGASLGLLVILIGACVFGTEAVFAVLRVRDIRAAVELRDLNGAEIVAPTAEPNAPTPDPNSIVNTLPSDGTLTVKAIWNYRIGPTFPQTRVVAEVRDVATNKVVAQNQYLIDCGSASLDCTGSYPIALEYGVQNQVGTRAAWPIGSYKLHVTRSFSDLKLFTLLDQAFVVGQ